MSGTHKALFYLCCWGETQSLTCARQMRGHWAASAALADTADERVNIRDSKTIKFFFFMILLFCIGKIEIIPLFLIRTQARVTIYFDTRIIQVLMEHEGNTGHVPLVLLLCSLLLNAKSI